MTNNSFRQRQSDVIDVVNTLALHYPLLRRAVSRRIASLWWKLAVKLKCQVHCTVFVLQLASTPPSSSPSVWKFSLSRLLMKTRGNKVLRLHRATTVPRFSKFLSVTPRADVRPAPNSWPRIPERLNKDMSVANRVPSMPGGHTLADMTSKGINAISPSVAKITSSPRANHWSGIPNCLLIPLMRISCVRPRGTDKRVHIVSSLFIDISFRRV
mmetsp:Transcript_14234/g.19809  ORF Transcript_14234/g.19809 Transcript_14234/m.19809 type:complete len:213 (+) Transcript_14234:8-646(+)